MDYAKIRNVSGNIFYLENDEIPSLEKLIERYERDNIYFTNTSFDLIRVHVKEIWNETGEYMYISRSIIVDDLKKQLESKKELLQKLKIELDELSVKC